MSGWFYGLVKKKNGWLSIWEITETQITKRKTILWAHPTPFKWKLMDFLTVIKDMWGQFKYMKRCWKESEFDKGNKDIAKYFDKLTKQTLKKRKVAKK